MEYEEALAYYPAVVAAGDVAGFVAPVVAACPDPEGILWAAWYTVTTAAATADDAARERLVALVDGVRDHPGPDDCRVWGLRVFADLPVFGAQMREEWNDDPPSRDPESWAGLNAFAARLTPGVHDFLRLGLWTISTALETFAEPAQHVPAAVEWFRHAGDQLLHATLHGRTYAARLGELASEAGVADPGFSVPRWIFWRSRLAGLAGTNPAAREGFRLIKRYDPKLAARF